MKKIVIVLLSLFVCGCSLQKEDNMITRESIEAETISLGAKKTDSKPIILVNNKQKNLYIGERDYDFGVEAYSDNGDVSIAYDDSEVNYEAQGTYLIKIIVNDLYSSNEDSAELSLKKKPIYSTAGSGTANAEGYLPLYFPAWGKIMHSPQEAIAYMDSTTMNGDGGQLQREFRERYSNISVEEWNSSPYIVR